MAAAWILIMILQGSGNAIGAQGNAMSVAEFTTQDRCVAAATAVQTSDVRAKYVYVCVEK